MTLEEIIEQLVNAVFTGEHRKELLAAIDDLSAANVTPPARRSTQEMTEDEKGKLVPKRN
jgi:hypothetical protein